jgi:hypothetical protein
MNSRQRRQVDSAHTLTPFDIDIECVMLLYVPLPLSKPKQNIAQVEDANDWIQLIKTYLLECEAVSPK